MKVQQPAQPFASTGGALPPLRTGFFPPLDCGGAIDAPEYLPAGDTVDVHIPLTRAAYVVGGLAYRSMQL